MKDRRTTLKPVNMKSSLHLSMAVKPNSNVKEKADSGKSR